ncbi:22154_t:CDS:2, partial [Racocetra persica]
VKRQSNRFDIKESTTYNDEVESDYNFSNFELAYRALDPSKMWVLNSSGRVVEKNEIFSSNPKQVPKIDEKIVNFLKKYNVDNLPTLQKVIFEPLFSDNAPYSIDLDYINLAYRSMYSLWRGEDDFTSASKLEGWFEMNIWAHLVDSAFCEMETDLVRGEGMCLSSSDRKNTDRSENDRKKFGKKGDGIFRLCNKRLEFGAIEAGRNWEGTKGTKLLTDFLKMSKMLKDMINVLATECNMKEDVLRKLQIAGILQGANMMQVITIDLPMGYVTRIHRRKFYEVPGRLNKYQPLGFIIMEVLFVKSVIKQTLNLINESKVDFEHFLNNYYENDGSQTPPQNIRVPSAGDITQSPARSPLMLDKKQIVKQELIEELQCQDLSRVCTDRNDIGESQHISDEINEPCNERISKTLILEFAPTLAYLFEKTTKSCQKEILRWYNYSLEMESKVFAIIAESKATEQTVRAWIYKEMLRHLPGILLVSLRIKTYLSQKNNQDESKARNSASSKLPEAEVSISQVNTSSHLVTAFGKNN